MNNQHTRYSSGQLFATFLGGAATGVAIALLTAPKSGKESRERIAGYLHQKGDAAARLPSAVKAASHAAKEAFSQSVNHRIVQSSNDQI